MRTSRPGSSSIKYFQHQGPCQAPCTSTRVGNVFTHFTFERGRVSRASRRRYAQKRGRGHDQECVSVPFRAGPIAANSNRREAKKPIDTISLPWRSHAPVRRGSSSSATRMLPSDRWARAVWWIPPAFRVFTLIRSPAGRDPGRPPPRQFPREVGSSARATCELQARQLPWHHRLQFASRIGERQGRPSKGGVRARKFGIAAAHRTRKAISRGARGDLPPAKPDHHQYARAHRSSGLPFTRARPGIPAHNCLPNRRTIPEG